MRRFSAPETRSTSARRDPSSCCCKAGICKTAPAAPVSLLQTDLWPAPVPATCPLAQPLPGDAPVREAQASADAQGWSNVPEAAGPGSANGTPQCRSPLSAPRGGWVRLWVLRPPRLAHPCSLPSPRVVLQLHPSQGGQPASSHHWLGSKLNQLPGRTLPQAHATDTPLN